MPTSISKGTTLITPSIVVGYETSREVRTIVHTIIGRSDPDITFKPAGLRTGTLAMVFEDHATALAAEAVHAAPGVLSLSDSDIPLANMRYVASGNLTLELDPDTQTIWLLGVDYAEVL